MDNDNAVLLRDPTAYSTTVPVPVLPRFVYYYSTICARFGSTVGEVHVVSIRDMHY